MSNIKQELSVNPELDIFSSNLINTSIISDQYIDYYPISPLVDDSVIQFDIPESYSTMLDPCMLLKLKIKITNATGGKLDADAAVAPTNLLLHALFQDVVLKANGVIISHTNGAYPYRAYIETNFTYSSEAKKGAIGEPQLYFQETTGKFSTTNAAENASFEKRVKKCALSKVVELAGRLHCDFLLQNRLIVPGVKFSISLFPTSNKFRILSGTKDPNEKLSLQSATLRVRRILLKNDAILAIEKALQVKPALYPIRRSIVRTAHIIEKTTHISNLVLHSGQVPRLVIITLVQSTAVEGHYTQNPFLFSLENCTFAQLELNGQLYPSVAYEPKSSWMDPYLNSLKGVNKLYEDSSAGLTFEDFSKDEGHQVLFFDLNPHDENTIPPRSNGVLNFSGKWGSNDITKNYTLFAFMIFDNIITIDGRRNVILDYTP